MRIETIDLEFQGKPHVIAAFVLRGPEGPVLVETGPGSTLPALRAGLARFGLEAREVRDVLVTHIHLDHSGAAGWWARQGARVHVHPLGAPHLVDPSKLLSSAGRIYGERMETLWGETLPAPADRVVAVEGGTVLRVGGLRVEAIETPGHARHHHAWRVDDVIFTGDAAGIRLPGVDWIDLPAPPPEFDLEAWRRTLGVLRQSGARRLYRTHFDAGAEDVRGELERFETVLEHGAAWVADLLSQELPHERIVERFGERMRSHAGDAGLDASLLEAYELANPRAMSVDGIARYWQKRGSVSR
jgi:glyoxylase-like metal-dependent hydrolase (beta-lactamase superfamily II)